MNMFTDDFHHNPPATGEPIGHVATDRLMTTKEAAEYLGCSEMSLHVRRSAKSYQNYDMPEFYYIGGCEKKPRICYKQSDLDAFLARKAAKKEAKNKVRLAKVEQENQKKEAMRQKRRALQKQGIRFTEHGTHVEAHCKKMVEHVAFLNVPFNPRDTEVVAFLAQGYTLEGVGSKFGLTRERARQLYNRACRVFENFLRLRHEGIRDKLAKGQVTI